MLLLNLGAFLFLLSLPPSQSLYFTKEDRCKDTNGIFAGYSATRFVCLDQASPSADECSVASCWSNKGTVRCLKLNRKDGSSGLEPWPDGTTCNGGNGWCQSGLCVSSSHDNKTDGVYGALNSASDKFGSCSLPCGRGVSVKPMPPCNSPAPSHGGKPCHVRDPYISLRRQTTCNEQACTDGKDPAHRQCEKVGASAVVKDFVSKLGPCVTLCKFTNGSLAAPLSSDDGSPCTKSNIDDGVCVRGECVPSPRSSCNAWANGARCESDGAATPRWCQDGQCVTVPSDIGGRVDGAYEDTFSSFGTCSKSCGTGIQETRGRACNNPLPSGGGFLCSQRSEAHIGPLLLKKTCNAQMCGGGEGTLDDYCKAKKDTHKGFWNPARLGSPGSQAHLECKLICSDSDPVMRPLDKSWINYGSVPDGTTCHFNSDGICYKGQCIVAPWASCSGWANGSRCDIIGEPSPKWCQAGKCVSSGIGKIDGNYEASFGPFGACSRPCGVGLQFTERRSCNNPEPSEGGRLCSQREDIGVPFKKKTCNEEICSVQAANPNQVRCESVKSGWTWVPWAQASSLAPVKASGNECRLYCRSSQGSLLLSGHGNIVDGETCGKSKTGMCLHGVCIEKPRIESPSSCAGWEDGTLCDGGPEKNCMLGTLCRGVATCQSGLCRRNALYAKHPSYPVDFSDVFKSLYGTEESLNKMFDGKPLDAKESGSQLSEDFRIELCKICENASLAIPECDRNISPSSSLELTVTQSCSAINRTSILTSPAATFNTSSSTCSEGFVGSGLCAVAQAVSCSVSDINTNLKKPELQSQMKRNESIDYGRCMACLCQYCDAEGEAGCKVDMFTVAFWPTLISIEGLCKGRDTNVITGSCSAGTSEKSSSSDSGTLLIPIIGGICGVLLLTILGVLLMRNNKHPPQDAPPHARAERDPMDRVDRSSMVWNQNQKDHVDLSQDHGMDIHWKGSAVSRLPETNLNFVVPTTPEGRRRATDRLPSRPNSENFHEAIAIASPTVTSPASTIVSSIPEMNSDDEQSFLGDRPPSLTVEDMYEPDQEDGILAQPALPEDLDPSLDEEELEQKEPTPSPKKKQVSFASPPKGRDPNDFEDLGTEWNEAVGSISPGTPSKYKRDVKKGKAPSLTVAKQRALWREDSASDIDRNSSRVSIRDSEILNSALQEEVANPEAKKPANISQAPVATSAIIKKERPSSFKSPSERLAHALAHN